jgi:hypothetical protein
MKNLTNDLNDIFNDSDIKITDMLKKLNINTRTRKITFSDALIYKFKYAQKYNTQKNIINDYKLETNNIIFVCDRAYFSYDLMNFLKNKNSKFVIRIKNLNLKFKKISIRLLVYIKTK